MIFKSISTLLNTTLINKIQFNIVITSDFVTFLFILDDFLTFLHLIFLFLRVLLLHFHTYTLKYLYILYTLLYIHLRILSILYNTSATSPFAILFFGASDGTYIASQSTLLVDRTSGTVPDFAPRSL